MDDKTALVLEGGGLRGTYTAGVLDYFMEHELAFPYVIGTSAGACNATGYLSGQIGRTKKINTELLHTSKYKGLGQLMKNGTFLNLDYLFDEIPNEILPFDYDAYEQNPARFVSTCTNCYTGLCEYYEKADMGRDMTAVRASSSLPLVAPMVVMGDGAYLDGGLSDSIPYGHALADGNDRCVVILTRPDGYRKKPSISYLFIKSLYKDFPLLLKSIKDRPETYNRQLEELAALEQVGTAFVIRPSKAIKIGRLSAKKEELLALYDLGYQDAASHYAALQDFLQKEAPENERADTVPEAEQ